MLNAKLQIRGRHNSDLPLTASPDLGLQCLSMSNMKALVQVSDDVTDNAEMGLHWQAPWRF
jgi:hypothetical protein